MENNFEIDLENFDQIGQNLNLDIEEINENAEHVDLQHEENGTENEIKDISEEEISCQQNDDKIKNNQEKSENNGKNVDNSPNLGKFKDVESLLSAYNSLQAEFTKKCQKLSELTKTCDNNACALPQEDWAEKVNSFLAKNQEAKPYAREISEILMNDTSLYESENGLEKAWTKVLLNNVLSLKEKMQDKSYVTEIVEKDDEIKQNIINEYVKTLKSKHSPNLMDKSGTSFAISKAEPVLNLEDASALVRAMLK